MRTYRVLNTGLLSQQCGQRCNLCMSFRTELACTQAGGWVNMAHIKGCVHASVAAQLPAGGHLALRVSGHTRAGVSADVLQALPGLRSLAASLSANSLARCQLPAAPGRRSAGFSCCNSIASPSASQLLAACQQAFATSALSPSQRQRRQRQMARSAAAAALEQEPAVEADHSTVPGGSAQPSTTQYVVVNFYHLTDISDPQQVVPRECPCAVQYLHIHLSKGKALWHSILHAVTAKSQIMLLRSGRHWMAGTPAAQGGAERSGRPRPHLHLAAGHQRAVQRAGGGRGAVCALGGAAARLPGVL